MLRFKFYGFITIALSAICFAGCAGKTAKNTDAAPAVSPEQIKSAIAASDELFRQREDLGKLREAIQMLARVRDMENRNYEVEWRFAEYNYFLGKRTSDGKEADDALADGEKAGKIASRLAPDKPEGYFWYGANLGEESKKSPVTVGIKAVDDIKEAMNKVIEIQPDYQGASAYDVLAQIELSTGLFGGKPEKAVEYLEKALTLEKNNTYIHLHLAQAYLDVDRKADAKKQLEYIITAKPAPEYAAEYEETLAEAKKLLERRF